MRTTEEPRMRINTFRRAISSSAIASFALATTAMLIALGVPESRAAGTEGVAAPPGGSITVFAAASLTESVQELATAYGKEKPGQVVRTSFASSGTLARQIEAGARVDVFLSADAEWMDELETHHFLVPGSRHTLLVNDLVLIAPATSTVQVRLAPNAPVLAALGGGRLAVADPDSVPAGRYARAAFTALGIWGQLEPHVVRAEDVRAALAWVARGEAPLGVVYATDARIQPKVRVVATFPRTSHPPIVYPIALVIGASPAAADFAAYLESATGRAVFVKYGFGAPTGP
jgi:molybdate transport system substrate-binding protein